MDSLICRFQAQQGVVERGGSQSGLAISPQHKNPALVWLATALSINVLLNVAISAGLFATGETVVHAFGATGPAQIIRLLLPSGHDSWRPMRKAHQRMVEDPGADLYDMFFVDHVKFQYPPSSLLVFDIFPPSMLATVDSVDITPSSNLTTIGLLKDEYSRLAHQYLDWLSLAATLVTALASAATLEIGLSHFARTNRIDRPGGAARFVVCLALGLTYYPLLQGYRLGQIQVFIDALVAFVLLFYLLGWELLAGACVGICCLVKPQYGLVLLWSLLTRKWRFTLGLVAVFLTGLTASLARFGLQNHLRYLEVLRTIARHGETYWPNQSVNGLLNRFLLNGDPLSFSFTDFAPFRPTVYVLTLLSSAVILALALWPRRGTHRQYGSPVDLMAILAAATIASPVAWEHHYGAFLPIFAAALPALIYTRPLGPVTAPLFALSYVTMANVILRPDLIFRNPWLGLTGSHLFFGGLILFSLLLGLRSAVWPGPTRAFGRT